MTDQKVVFYCRNWRRKGAVARLCWFLPSPLVQFVFQIYISVAKQMSIRRAEELTRRILDWIDQSTENGGKGTRKWLFRWYSVIPFMPIDLSTGIGVSSANYLRRWSGTTKHPQCAAGANTMWSWISSKAHSNSRIIWPEEVFKLGWSYGWC